MINLLNSNFIIFIFKKFYAGGGLGEQGYRYKKVFLEKLPILKIKPEQQKPFIDLVNQILAIISIPNYNPKNPPNQTKRTRKQIDEMVYELYELTDEEIKIIEKN